MLGLEPENRIRPFPYQVGGGKSPSTFIAIHAVHIIVNIFQKINTKFAPWPPAGVLVSEFIVCLD
jgi:hypothetical protein